MLNIEFSGEENRIKIVSEDTTSDDDQEALEAAGKNPLAAEESVEEDCRGHE
ncbi:MAG TPA: hypothetical protein VMU25_00610 [Candidatus Paceibacterota bacterium]|nr:hypothetical protein [Candidatus Paceibacterota bacterium]